MYTVTWKLIFLYKYKLSCNGKSNLILIILNFFPNNSPFLFITCNKNNIYHIYIYLKKDLIKLLGLFFFFGELWVSYALLYKSGENTGTHPMVKHRLLLESIHWSHSQFEKPVVNTELCSTAHEQRKIWTHTMVKQGRTLWWN